MHPEAWWFIEDATVGVRSEPVAVVDFGSRDVNGSPRSLFPAARLYTGVDIEDGPGVDVKADAASWRPDQLYDVVICAEVLEHTPAWRDIMVTAREVLDEDGLLVVTAATNPREPHSAVDGWDLRPGEYYGNVDPEDLRDALYALGFIDVVISTHPRGDVYASARR